MGFKIVRLSGEIFQEILTEGWTAPNRSGWRVRCVQGLPPGAEIVDLSRDVYFNENLWALKVFHPDWPDTRPGEALPVFGIQHVTEPMHPDPEANRILYGDGSPGPLGVIVVRSDSIVPEGE